MKVITEMVLRNELKGECPPVYYVPKDKLLSPAAKEYLNQLKIKVEFGDPPAAPTAKLPPSAILLPEQNMLMSKPELSMLKSRNICASFSVIDWFIKIIQG